MTTAKIKLPTGFTVRPATMDDVQITVDLFNDVEENQVGIRSAKFEHVKSRWTSPGFNMANNTRLVFDSTDRLVGAAGIGDTSNPPVDMWISAAVHPDFENMGIGTFLNFWGETRARESFSRCPDDAQIDISTGIYSNYHPGRKLLEDLGMKLGRQYWDMQIMFDGTPVPQPQWPQDVTIRTYQHNEDFKDVIIAENDAFKDHYGYVERVLEDQFKNYQHWIDNATNLDFSMWYLAMAGDEIAGICLCAQSSSEGDHIGYVDSLGVRPPWRKQGLALALLHQSFGEFYRRGKKGVELGVDASSITGATKLYERAGMSVKRRFDVYTKVLRPGRDLARRE